MAQWRGAIDEIQNEKNQSQLTGAKPKPAKSKPKPYDRTKPKQNQGIRTDKNKAKPELIVTKTRAGRSNQSKTKYDREKPEQTRADQTRTKIEANL